MKENFTPSPEMQTDLVDRLCNFSLKCSFLSEEIRLE